ncbi:MAG: AgmX/PglI C-terminal domain-containing protein [Oligoflexales bacterium]
MRPSVGWRGFVVSGGAIHEVDENAAAKKRYSLKLNDYASISKNDLTVLVKVAKEHVQKRVPITGKYKAGILSLLFNETHIGKVLPAAFTLTTLILGGFTLGLLNRKVVNPTNMEDLGPRYTLPMISSKHLETLPEALQMNLNRRTPVSSAIKFYRNISLLVSGFPVEDDRLLFSSSLARWHEDYTQMLESSAKLDNEQRGVDQRFVHSDNVALLNIPAIPQEANIEAMARIKDKIATMHQSFEYTLEKRRETTKDFLSDTNYDFEDYKAPVKKANSALSQIDVFSMLTDEQAMYEEAKSLARKSDRAKDYLKRTMRADSVEDSGVMVLIKPNDNLISPTIAADFISLNKKIYSMRSSLYEHATGRIAEPMLGELDRNLIEGVVDTNQYQLQLCFELALKRNKTTSGRMEWQWILNSKGEISAIELVSSSIKDPQMTQCVKQKILSWKFPKPRRGSIEIVHPFVFKQTKG